MQLRRDVVDRIDHRPPVGRERWQQATRGERSMARKLQDARGYPEFFEHFHKMFARSQNG
jgi:hypothetical protein